VAGKSASPAVFEPEKHPHGMNKASFDGKTNGESAGLCYTGQCFWGEGKRTEGSAVKLFEGSL